MADNPKISAFNIANVITTFRLIIAPVFIGVYLYVYLYEHTDNLYVWLVAILYMVGAASDKLDGYLARKYEIITDYGKIVDPIADKALVLGAFVCMSITGNLPWLFTVVVAAREFGITALRAFMLKDVVIPASDFGKWKTVSQMFLIFLAVFPFQLVFNMDFIYRDYLHIIFNITMWIALFMTVFSFTDYIYKAIKIRKQIKSGNFV